MKKQAKNRKKAKQRYTLVSVWFDSSAVVRRWCCAVLVDLAHWSVLAQQELSPFLWRLAVSPSGFAFGLTLGSGCNCRPF